MKNKNPSILNKCNLVWTALAVASVLSLGTAYANFVYSPGHSSLQKWLLPEVPHPADNKPNAERVELGKMLFFDPRLSGDGNMSCATCHSPLFGWSDALPTARGVNSMVLGRATPTITNTAYNSFANVGWPQKIIGRSGNGSYGSECRNEYGSQ